MSARTATLIRGPDCSALIVSGQPSADRCTCREFVWPADMGGVGPVYCGRCQRLLNRVVMADPFFAIEVWP